MVLKENPYKIMQIAVYSLIKSRGFNEIYRNQEKTNDFLKKFEENS